MFWQGHETDIRNGKRHFYENKNKNKYLRLDILMVWLFCQYLMTNDTKNMKEAND